MGGSWAQEVEDRRRQAHEQVPENLDIALEEIADLRGQVDTLRVQIAAQNSARARYKDYVLGGVVGAIISLLLTTLL